ncbi:hypothetical protein KFE25_004460 [Diacronema lutheri]|uniref:Peptidase M12B domain-containing protein n=3 Tax=Diacronema lutheri TaxID=2081491 RepID=A0A8J5XB57_DIALT|nr:hypothetical protein KFE25_004460 [Diacronema lutheri]
MSVLLLVASLVAGSRPALKLREWHAISELRVVAHGALERTTTLAGASIHVAERLALSFGVGGRRHAFNLTRADAFGAGASVSVVRGGEREPSRAPPHLKTYFARDARGRLVASGTVHADGSVRALVREGAKFLIVEPAADAHVEMPPGMAQPRVGKPFAYYAHDAQIEIGDDELLLHASSRPDAPPPGSGHVRHAHRHAAPPARRGPHGGGGGVDATGTEHGEGGHRRRLAELFATCPQQPHRMVLGMVIDQLAVQKIGGGPDGALAYIADLITVVNAVYTEQLNLELVVDRVIVFENNGATQFAGLPASYPAQVGTSSWCEDTEGVLISPNDLLFGLRSWSGEHAELRPAWHMLTGCNSPSTVVGYAFNNITCRAQMQTGYNVGYSQHIGSFTWMVMAHELGHNLGSGHTPDGIMRASVAADSTSFDAPSGAAICEHLGKELLIERFGVPPCIVPTAGAADVDLVVNTIAPPSPPSPPNQPKSPPSPPPSPPPPSPPPKTEGEVVMGGDMSAWTDGKKGAFERATARVLNAEVKVTGVTAASVVVSFVIYEVKGVYTDAQSVVAKLGDVTVVRRLKEAIAKETGFAVESDPRVTKTTDYTFAATGELAASSGASRIGAIVGGVVGGFFGLVLLIALPVFAYWWYRRRKLAVTGAPPSSNPTAAVSVRRV